MNFDSTQQMAINKAIEWLKYGTKTKNEFVIAGLAGTGKSSVIPSIIEGSDVRPSRVLYIAFTGAVCNMLTARGIPAKTIHSTIYMNEKRYNAEKGKYIYITILKEPEMLREYDLFVLDELSTVNDKLMTDLRTFNIPILCMGDPGQFKAIGGSDISQSLLQMPDVFFKTVYRNGGDLLECAYKARRGDFSFLKKGFNGSNLGIISKYDTQTVDLISLNASQIISHSNKERIQINDRIRLLKGYEGVLPNVGEKIICIENNWDITSNTGILSLTNGMQGIVTSVAQDEQEQEYYVYNMSFRNNILKNEEFNNLKCDETVYTGDEFASTFHAERRLMFNVDIFNQFDYGYAITGYKSQGSQWKQGLVMGAKMNMEELSRYYYTVMTRFEKRVIIAI